MLLSVLLQAAAAGVGVSKLGAAIGAGLLFFGIKNMLSEEKIKKAKAAKNAAMEAAAGGELKKEDASGQNRSMSIAERANMVKNLEDEEEDGENEKE